MVVLSSPMSLIVQNDQLLPLQAGIATAAGLGLFAGAARYAVKGAKSQVFGRSVCAGPGNRRSIALTFDDGPSPGTMDLLEYLEQQNVAATFFQCGANIERHPEISRAVHQGGHEIGNHTFSHRRLCPRLGWQPNILSRKTVVAEFSRTQRLLEEMGITPRLLRAPYGLRWFGLRETQKLLNLLGVMWTVIGRDWEWDGHAVADLVLRTAVPGGIVCLHDGRDTRPDPDIRSTLDAVRRIVPMLKGAGYSFERVSEIIQP